MKFFVSTVVFSADLSHVVLLYKTTSPVLTGWNLPGGHLETTDADELGGAMRELREETGVCIPRPRWKALPLIESPNVWCFCFTAADDAIFRARTVEREPVTVYPVAQLHTLPLVADKWSAFALIQSALARHGMVGAP